MRDIKWSKPEKVAARQAFDNAYRNECTAIVKKCRELADSIKDPDDIWELHDFLSEKRKEIDEKYDYRYSVLIFVFSRLLKEGWLEESDIKGFNEDKLMKIKALLNFGAD